MKTFDFSARSEDGLNNSSAPDSQRRGDAQYQFSVPLSPLEASATDKIFSRRGFKRGMFVRFAIREFIKRLGYEFDS